MTQVVQGLELFPPFTITASSETRTLHVWSTTKHIKRNFWLAPTQVPENTENGCKHLHARIWKKQLTAFVSLVKKYLTGLHNLYYFF